MLETTPAPPQAVGVALRSAPCAITQLIRGRRVHCAHICAAHASGIPHRELLQQRFGEDGEIPHRHDGMAISARSGYLFAGCPEETAQLRHEATKGIVGSVLEQVCGHPLHFSAHVTANLWRGRDKTFLIPYPSPPFLHAHFFFWSAARNALVRKRKSEGADGCTCGQNTFPYKVPIYREVVCFPVVEKH